MSVLMFVSKACVAQTDITNMGDSSLWDYQQLCVPFVFMFVLLMKWKTSLLTVLTIQIDYNEACY